MIELTELHTDVNITWHKHSLQAFADAPLADLAARFDLMVIDHPSIGEAAHQSLLIPLDLRLPAAFLADQKQNCVGQSHDSYNIDGHQYALAIDAATPISGFRPDLLTRADAEPPRTWSELLALAHRGLAPSPSPSSFGSTRATHSTPHPTKSRTGSSLPYAASSSKVIPRDLRLAHQVDTKHPGTDSDSKKRTLLDRLALKLNHPTPVESHSFHCKDGRILFR